MECYNEDMRTFFLPIGEMCMAVHNMHKVTRLLEGDYPYKEFVMNLWELLELKERTSLMLEVYWEVLYHYFICGNVNGKKGSGILPLT